MTEKEREGYRSRLNVGDIVYFVEGKGVTGSPRDPLVVKKASVSATTLKGDSVRHYPLVALWDQVDIDPKGLGYNVAKSPRELFTPEEVLRAIRKQDGPLEIDDRPVDALIVDPITNGDLTAVLGGVIMHRLLDDELRNSGDPEY
ncbi:hypothetical protein IPL68_07530 [Candidatus Saccharibacteria bacterium]|nr:MAG: hypothetical protein IPL68_07530 [Candidatus Saccharibacteria bacterium]